MTGVAAVAVAWLLTYLAHSTLLLGGVAVATRWVVKREALRETLWKTALVGGLVTATVAMAVPRPVAPRVPLAALGVVSDGQDATRTNAWEAEMEADAEGAAAGVDLDAEAGADVQIDAAAELDVVPELASGQGADRPSLGDAEGDLGVGGAGPVGGDPPSTDRRQAGGATWPSALALLWAIGAVALLGRLGYRHARLRWLLRDRVQVPGSDGAAIALTELRRSAGVWKPVRLTASPSVATPLALGWVEVCVPERFLEELEPAEQRAALAHELAHLARRDPVWQVAGAVIGAALFVQPLNLLARRGIRSAAEYLADGWAVAQTGSQMELARCLAAVAGWVAPSSEPVLAGTVAMAEGGSPLLARVQRLLEHAPEAATRPALRAAVAVGVLAAVTGFAPGVGPAVSPPPSAVPDGSAAERTSTRETMSAPAAAAPIAVPAPAREAQDPLDVRRFDRAGAEGDGFVARLNEAERDARRTPHWVAYAVPAVAGADEELVDSDPWRAADLAGPPLADRLGVAESLAGSPGRALVLVRLVPAGAATRVERVAVRWPHLGMRLDGRVYWLGLADALPSFRWLRDIYVAVEDEDERVAEASVEAIAMHATPEALPFLRDVLERDGGTNVRQEAVEGMRAQAPDTVVARLFFDVAMRDPDGDVRREATEQLGRLRDPVGVTLLKRLAWDAPDPDVRRQAAESLGEAGTESAREALVWLLEEHPDEGVRREALDQLAATGPGLDGGALLALAMTADDPDLRREAVEQMASLPPDEAVAVLRQAVFESGDGTVERQAAETLGDVGTEAALRTLLEILERNPSEGASFQAVESVGENWPDEMVVRALGEVARRHPSSRVRAEALDYLSDRGG